MFYHSFPRPKLGQDSRQKGLKILESFLKNGILLVPETITYNWEKNDEEKTQEKYNVVQRRFCLTQIDISELMAHEKHFGNFHIEFMDKDVYTLGAIPVFYLPRAESDLSEWSLKKLAAGCIYGLNELQTLCGDIQNLAEMADNNRTQDEIYIKGKNWTKENPKVYTVNVKQLRNILDMLTANLVPNSIAIDKGRSEIGARVDGLLGIIKCICSLLYPSDKDFGGEHEDLYFFRQREWRIIGGISMDGEHLDRELNKSEKNFVLSIDPAFFGKKITYADRKEQSLLDGCTIMPSVLYEAKLDKSRKSKPVQDLVQRIIVPKTALKDAKVIAEKNNFDSSRVVDFETAMDIAACDLEYESVKTQCRIQMLKAACMGCKINKEL